MIISMENLYSPFRKSFLPVNDQNIRIQHFKNLVAIASADGVMDADEKDFLIEKAEELGIPKEEVDEIMNNLDGLEFEVPQDMEDKEDQLADIVFMAMIDGEIHDTEYNLCLKIADKLGLKKEDVDEVINLTRRLWAN